MRIDRVGIKGKNDNDFIMLDQFGLHLMWRTLSAPKGFKNYETIPAMNGRLDTSEEFGEMFYDMRSLSLNCIYVGDDWHESYGRLLSRYHEQEVKIMFSNDPAYYWAGRLTVTKYDAKSHKLTMTASVYPYKFKRDKTVVELSDTRSRIVTLRNGRMPVVPKITVDAPVTIAWDTYSKSVTFTSYPATFTLAGLRLTEGEKEVAIVPSQGSFSIKFEYREGAL